jgi:hypothetical protein
VPEEYGAAKGTAPRLPGESQLRSVRVTRCQGNRSPLAALDCPQAIQELHASGVCASYLSCVCELQEPCAPSLLPQRSLRKSPLCCIRRQRLPVARKGPHRSLHLTLVPKANACPPESAGKRRLGCRPQGSWSETDRVHLRLLALLTRKNYECASIMSRTNLACTTDPILLAPSQSAVGSAHGSPRQSRVVGTASAPRRCGRG